MKKLLSCAFNMDSGCVELKFNDGSMIAISGQSLTILSTMTRWRMPTSF